MTGQTVKRDLRVWLLRVCHSKIFPSCMRWVGFVSKRIACSMNLSPLTFDWHVPGSQPIGISCPLVDGLFKIPRFCCRRSVRPPHPRLLWRHCSLPLTNFYFARQQDHQLHRLTLNLMGLFGGLEIWPHSHLPITTPLSPPDFNMSKVYGSVSVRVTNLGCCRELAIVEKCISFFFLSFSDLVI